MPESTLDVIIKNTTTGLPTVAAEKAAITELGNQTVVLSEKTKAHALAERDLARDASISARALGETGAKGGELFERFTNLTTAAGGLQGTLLGIGILGAGAVVEGFRKVDETYREQQRSTLSLKQATEATHTSFEDLNSSFEKWVDSNQNFISNENEARDALARFVRAGDDAKTSMDDLSLALDLSAGYHISLEDAARRVILAEQGQGRALKELGIDLASLKQDDENAVKAHKDYEQATKDVTTAQDELSKAQERLKILEDELSAKHKTTAADADRLAQAHKNVEQATQKLQGATDAQKKAQDSLNGSMSTAQQVHDQLHGKVDDLRKSTDEHQQAVNHLSHEWDSFSSHTGPGVEAAFNGILNAASAVLYVLDGIATALDTVNNKSAAGIAHGTGRPVPVTERQHGGPVMPGGVYTVGEAGPETLVMGQGGGYVIPQAGGSATYNLTLVGAGAVNDPEGVRRMLQRMQFLGIAS